MKQILSSIGNFKNNDFSQQLQRIERETSGRNSKNNLGRKFSHIILLILISLGCSFQGYSQNCPRYPIPSYNVSVDGLADFSNQSSVSQKNSLIEKKSIARPENKRHVIISLSLATASGQSCQATVWVYSLDLTTVLGPYYLNCGDEISVEIDDRQWGVMVESQDKVVMDVWFDDGSTK